MPAAYLVHAERYNAGAEGKPASEVASVNSIRPVRELYATPTQFGPRSLAVRQRVIGLGWCRSLANKRIERSGL